MTPALVTELKRLEREAAPGKLKGGYTLPNDPEALALKWPNPFIQNEETVLAYVYWPTHPPEATEQVEQWFENLVVLLAALRNAAPALLEAVETMHAALERIEENPTYNPTTLPISECDTRRMIAREALARVAALLEKGRGK